MTRNLSNVSPSDGHRAECESRAEPGSGSCAHPSIHFDHLIYLETGARVVLLRRHLSLRLGMSPDEYRRKWRLPADYPMVAPAYRRARAASVCLNPRIRKSIH